MEEGAGQNSPHGLENPAFVLRVVSGRSWIFYLYIYSSAAQKHLVTLCFSSGASLLGGRQSLF